MKFSLEEESSFVIFHQNGKKKDEKPHYKKSTFFVWML